MIKNNWEKSNEKRTDYSFSYKGSSWFARIFPPDSSNIRSKNVFACSGGSETDRETVFEKSESRIFPPYFDKMLGIRL